MGQDQSNATDEKPLLDDAEIHPEFIPPERSINSHESQAEHPSHESQPEVEEPSLAVSSPGTPSGEPAGMPSGEPIVAFTDVDENWEHDNCSIAGHEERPLIITGHRGAVNDCAVSPDSEWLLTVGADGYGRVWKASGEELCELRGHDGEVRSCSIFPDCQRALTSGQDGTVRIWNAKTGELVHVLSEHEGPVFGCKIFADGKRAVTTGSDCQCIIWDITAGTVIRSLQGPEDPRDRREPVDYKPRGENHSVEAGSGPCCCAISPDDRQIALVSGDDGDFAAKVWDTDTGDQVCELGEQCTFACAFFPDGLRLVTLGEEFGVHDATVWDISTEEELCTLKGHHYINFCIVFPSRDIVLSAGDDGLARVWRFSREAPQDTAQYCAFDCGEVQVRSCAIFPDGQRVITVSSDGLARIWALP